MFEDVRFDGQFRSYQQKVLDHADKYLKDGHIHIVAAPGSGKTVLGLELIRRLGKRALVLSPTTTIRNQWGERFSEKFTGSEGRVSYDLLHPSDITSVTYQALCSAMRRKRDEEEGGDYSAFDLPAAVKKYGISTICLDEAHHLQNEWQKALEAFLQSLDEVKTIALTATPPYDASPGEWSRYIALCGEIDEEIFVPELVKQGTICPHQDYVYFNFPTKKETERFTVYRARAAEAVRLLCEGEYVQTGYERLLKRMNDYDFLYDNANGASSFLVLCCETGIRVEKRLLRRLAVRRPFAVTAERVEKGTEFLLNELLYEEERALCIKIFKERDLVTRGKISLDLDERLRKQLLSSVGKLKGISEIVAHENAAMGDGLRLLILTDYIKKESLSVIGTEREPDSVSVVSVYETARRTGVPAGALSGSLVILPRECSARLKELDASFRMSKTADQSACVFEIDGGNIEKVGYVGRLFEEGLIRVLVGTKSLLGEGWDAPFVNTLILASFVGSFMLSNQMRGRAIRVYRGDEEKTANIWHLVTVERPCLSATSKIERLLYRAEKPDVMESYDFQTVSRRFECFAAPDYDTGNIRSGVERISAIRPPYDEKGIERINREMFDRSAHRDALRQTWRDGLDHSAAKLNEVSEIPKKNAERPSFIFVNALTFLFVAALMQVSVYAATSLLIDVLQQSASVRPGEAICILCLYVLAFCLLVYAIRLLFKKLLIWLSPKKSMEKIADCVMKTMKNLSLISEDARLGVSAVNDGVVICIELLNASVHDQNLFQGAMEDLFSPIRNPRYILIPKVLGMYSYRRALACPDILASKSEYARELAQNLKSLTGKMHAVYTRTESGRRLILKCRKAAYITQNHAAIHRSRRISRWE